MQKGMDFERDMKNYLNNHEFSDLTAKWQKHLKRIFPEIKKGDSIRVTHYWDYSAKPDLIFEFKGRKAFVSIKYGNGLMHGDYFSRFTKFLKSLGVSDKTLETLYLYHYGTFKKGSSKVLTREEIIQKYPKEILEANKEFNKREIVEAVVKRCVIKGAQDYRQEIDYFYYGTLKNGFLCNVSQIYESILSNRNPSNSYIHFGELSYRPHVRDPKNDKIDLVKISWPILSALFYRHDDDNDIMKRDSLLYYFEHKDDLLV